MTSDPTPSNDPDLGELASRLGIVLAQLSGGRAVARMPVAGNRQPQGLLNGGASAALVETAGSALAASQAGPGGSAVAIELSVSHHHGVRSGSVTAVATALHTGRTIASYQVVLSDDSGRRVATGRLTCVLRRAADAEEPDGTRRDA